MAVSAVRTVTNAPADRASSGTSASAAATAPHGREASTVTDGFSGLSAQFRPHGWRLSGYA